MASASWSGGGGLWTGGVGVGVRGGEGSQGLEEKGKEGTLPVLESQKGETCWFSPRWSDHSMLFVLHLYSTSTQTDLHPTGRSLAKKESQLREIKRSILSSYQPYMIIFPSVIATADKRYTVYSSQHYSTFLWQSEKEKKYIFTYIILWNFWLVHLLTPSKFQEQ